MPMTSFERERAEWIEGLTQGRTRQPASPDAVRRFRELLSGGDGRADACATLYAQARLELADDEEFSRLASDELRLLWLADDPRAELREIGAYRARRVPREGAAPQDFLAGTAFRPAYPLRRSHCWPELPRMDQLGVWATRMVLWSLAHRLGERDIAFVLSEGARLDEHPLAWARLLGEALGGADVRLLRLEWSDAGWGRGLASDEGIQLAGFDGTTVQRLVDLSTGDAFALRLWDEGTSPDGERAYRLDLVRDVRHDASRPKLDTFEEPAGTWALVPGGQIEKLQLDRRNHRLVAKFDGQFHLLEYDSWTRAWQKPIAAVMFGESGYDRAYYLGQGCWENMVDLSGATARALLEHGWLGAAWLGGGELQVQLPNGRQVTVSLTAGIRLGMLESALLHGAPEPGQSCSPQKENAQTSVAGASRRMGLRELVGLFDDTRAATRRGSYQLGGRTIGLGVAREHAGARVYSAGDVVELIERPDYPMAHSLGGRCQVAVTDEDSLEAARYLACELPMFLRGKKPPLVLNFANPHEPGGGVAQGALAQEEDLCRRSTLYASLSSREAGAYYAEGRASGSSLFTHACALSPHVEVFRAADGTYLEQPFEVAVLTVAAPYVPGLKGVTTAELRACIRTRILGMLHVAAANGYENLVLGAWGCGAFGNDPQMVAECFRDALHEYRAGVDSGPDYNSAFRQVRFAVPGGPNHDAFERALADVHREEDDREYASVRKRIAQREQTLDRVQGCLVGGAVGDALGYPVEFMSRDEMCATFGPAGIRRYWLERTGGTALFSDDTQMTLFTAAGLLEGQTRQRLRGVAGDPASCIYRAYLDWLHTQDENFEDNPGSSFLVQVPELHSLRAPGNTCLSALRSRRMGTMDHPLNHSKGCGGVMRVAPVGLFARDIGRAWYHAAAAAAITHGHPMGYIPAAALARIVELCAFGKAGSLREAVDTCCKELPGWFEDEGFYARDMAAQLRRAAALAEGDAPDHECVAQLGEGWVGDEALAIAAFCCLRHSGSFDEAIIAAVNHDGDSDSTGAITGNIMGACLGLGAIGPQWTERLELHQLLLLVGRDLCDGCQMSEYGHWRDEEWLARWGGSGKGTPAINDLLQWTME